MGLLSRWLSRRKKSKEFEQTPGAFSSTPTLDLHPHGPQSDDHHHADVSRRTSNRPVESKTTPSDPRRPVRRTERPEKEVGSGRWEQQLLAWRLSAYEDARRWDMIDAETHKLLRHHAFLTPPPASVGRPIQSAPARSQTFSTSSTLPTPSSPLKTSPHFSPPSSWNRPQPKPAGQGSSNHVPPNEPTLSSFLSIPGSPTRPRSRLRTSRSVASTISNLDETHPASHHKPKKETPRNSFIACLQPLPSAPIYRVQDDLGLLARTKREMLTDDSPTGILRAEWERSRAEMRVVCGPGGIEDVVERIGREMGRWREKCGWERGEMDEDCSGELSRLRRMIEELAMGKGNSGEPLTALETRDDVRSTTTHSSTADVTSLTPGHQRQASFSTNPHLQPPANPHMRRTPSQLSGKSGNSFFSERSWKSNRLGGRFGLNKGIQVSSPITPSPSIVNHRVAEHRQPVHPEDTPSTVQASESTSVDRLLRLADLRQLEATLCKLIEESKRLEKVKAGYEERVELLQVKVRAAELRDQLVGR